jgi:hypothetical protein
MCAFRVKSPDQSVPGASASSPRSRSFIDCPVTAK